MKTTRANRLKNKNLILSEEKNKVSINQKILYDIYKNEFIDECDTIIIEKQKDFLEKYFNKIHLIIKNNYGNSVFEQNSSINDIKKCENDFINEIYSPMYNSCVFGLKKYNSTKIHNITKEYLTNFLPHCSFDQVPLHTCGSKFIYINNINTNKKIKNNPSFVLCIGCHKCYYDSCIKMYCPYCQMKFYSYLIEKNKNNIYPATWKKYHCEEYMNNEQMTCIRCENKLWVKDDILICKNCNLEVKPEDIIWTCIICKKEFKSKVKIYNELEFKEINYEIKNALLYKKIVKPNELPCKCLSINQINNIDFNHKSSDGCKGILYYGSIDNKEFVVCSLCKKMTYLNKFLWNCPICNKNFICKRVKFYQINNNYINNSNNNNENYYSNKKYKKNQHFYSHLSNINNNSNNNTQRDIKKADSYIKKYIELNNSNDRNNINIEIEPTEKRRNNSLIISNRNNNIFNLDNQTTKNNNNNCSNNCDSNLSQGGYHLIHENKNNSSNSTVYSSVSYYNSSREREKETHKKIVDNNNTNNPNNNNNSSFRFRNIFNNKINDKKDISFSTNKEDKKINITLTNEKVKDKEKEKGKDGIIINNKKYNNYIYEYNNNNKRETISSFNLRKGLKDQNKNIIISKLSYNNNNNQTNINKVYVPKKNINNSLSISINEENNISNNNININNNNITDNKYINRFNLKTNDTQNNNNIFFNKIRNYSGPKIINYKIYINSKYKDIINTNNNNNNYNNAEVRQSSQPKIEINKLNNIRRNKIINIDESLSKSNISDISDNNNCNNSNINNTDNKIKNRYAKTKDNYYKRDRKKEKEKEKENISITNSNHKDNSNNKSYIGNLVTYINNIQTKRDNKNNINDINSNKNNLLKSFDNNSREIRKNIKSNNNSVISNENEEDELKEFNFDEYKIITQLGQGTFGKIYLVQDKAKQLFSMKKIVLSEELDVQSVIKEYRMCYKIKHPNVIKILGIYNNKLDKTTYVVYVLMEVGLTDWEKEIKSYYDKHIEYTESELINIIKQLTSVLAFLQRKNISHRDIKPQNILVFKNKIYKIADFGEAKQIDNISKSLVVNSLRGTELYMSPLLFNGLRTGQVDIKHNMFKSDVYSFGLCILYAAVTSNKPLYETRKFVEMNSVKRYVNKLLKNKYTNKFIQLLCTMIEIHEKNRPDFIELENIMKNWKN